MCAFYSKHIASFFTRMLAKVGGFLPMLLGLSPRPTLHGYYSALGDSPLEPLCVIMHSLVSSLSWGDDNVDKASCDVLLVTEQVTAKVRQ